MESSAENISTVYGKQGIAGPTQNEKSCWEQY